MTLRADALEFKGYKSFFVGDLVLAAVLVNHRRERWLTPEGKVIIAPLPEGVSSGFGRNLPRPVWRCMPRGRSRHRAWPRFSTASASRSRSGRLSGCLSSSSRETVRFCTPGLSRRPSSRSTMPVPYIRRNAFTTQIVGERFSTFVPACRNRGLISYPSCVSGEKGEIRAA